MLNYLIPTSGMRLSCLEIGKKEEVKGNTYQNIKFLGNDHFNASFV